jgi:hypothetical protein
VATSYNVETFTDNVKKIEFGDDINPQVKRSMVVNDIIIQSIEDNKYRELYIRVWGNRKKKLMESTIYKRVWKEIQSKR